MIGVDGAVPVIWAGPIEFSPGEIMLIFAIVFAPAILFGVFVGIWAGRRARPGLKVIAGVGGFLGGTLVGGLIEFLVISIF